ncbi:MAG TPA: hypothetical protein VG097_09590 [Gemmata sp.]|nr:hypothetical protein [Gemmata sp.]
MELSVLIQQTAGNGFRAWCGEPIPTTAEGATREEALSKLRAALETKTLGVEVVRLNIGPNVATSPVWPDDQITRDWLAGIAAARESADRTPDPWDEPMVGQP